MVLLLRAFLLLPAAIAATSCEQPSTWRPLQPSRGLEMGTALRGSSNVTAILLDAQKTMRAAFNAILSTHARSTGPSAGLPSDINARVMSPKPVDNVTDASGLALIYIDTNSLSRKYAEIQDAVAEHGAARANLLYYDRDGAGYVALRGNASIAEPAEARREWWDGWAPFFPQKENTSFYSVIRFELDALEMSSGPAQSGRADWMPVTLRRKGGVWTVEVAPGPPAPAPPAPPPVSDWKCSVCQHVYDPQRDGAGLPFEETPATFKCPVCGAPKSAFRKVAFSDGSEKWVHEELI
eukprot:TRINITY_DN72663_c0_g1_i1.p1 TRINITY_DN72663_c0_g1~~TRINITY_DN72663_c0_g1_i1.p1  ORF type:complete len:308 (+),score=27.33 TRINITY_DN72663_c0_g1_i1:42-926(+)